MKQQTVAFGGREIPVDTPEAEEIPEIDLSMLDGKVKTGSNAMVKVWEFQIIDPNAVLSEFLSVDEKKVREFMRYKTQMGDTPETPGIVFSSRMDVRSR